MREEHERVEETVERRETTPLSDVVSEVEEKQTRSPYPSRFKVTGGPSGEFREMVREIEFNPKGKFAGEREKKEEDLESVAYINLRGKELGKKYGFEWVEVPPEYIHILPEEAHREFLRGEGEKDDEEIEAISGSANYLPHLEIRDKPSDLARADNMFHEVLHGEASHHLHLMPEKYRKLFLTSRTGWRRRYMHSGFKRPLQRRRYEGTEKVVFNDLNEAVTSILTREALDTVSEDSRAPFREEARRVKKVKSWLDTTDLPAGMSSVASEEALQELEKMQARDATSAEVREFDRAFRKQHGFSALTISYSHERGDYVEILEYISEKNPEEFPKLPDVHGVFVRAMMNGEILPLARVIEKTFGKSPIPRGEKGERLTTFREFGEKGLCWLRDRIREQDKPKS